MSEADDNLAATPLGIAARAIGEAELEISEAWDQWMRGPKDERPWDYNDLDLRPDHSSLGFVLVLHFSENMAQSARSVAKKLGPILAKLGVARVACVSTRSDEAEIPT